MIVVYSEEKNFSPISIHAENQTLLAQALWIDLLNPTKEEEEWVKNNIDLMLPSREEMSEIELSSRLYKEQDVLFMTASMVAQSASSDPKRDAVTFILTKKQVLTIRYIEPYAFQLFISKLQKTGPLHHNATGFLIELLESTINRLADILEVIGRNLDQFSKTIFHFNDHSDDKLDYQILMQQIGNNGDLTSKAHESLVAFHRLITFFSQAIGTAIDNDVHTHLSTLHKDITALNEHANFMSGKVTFLLDATLGLVNIEQNNIIKIFSVAAVIFLPPTLLASIYGMNFKNMPELSWPFGYPMAIVLMVLFAWLPYRYFKTKKWL